MRTRMYNPRSRGQAAVELSLLSIIVVPTTLYVLFLDDMLRFKLDQQEAIISSTWDGVTLDYEDPNAGAKHINVDGAASVAYFNRLSYGDHNSVDSRYSDPAYIDDSKHHLAVGAHQCWLVGGKKNQVTCSPIDKTVGAQFYVDPGPGMQKATQDASQTGGYYSCTGRIGVINNWLPPDTLSQFSQEKLTRTDYHHDAYTSVHGTGAGYADNDRGVYHFPADTFSVVADTWAMTTYDDVDPDGNSGKLYDRVKASYNSTSTDVVYAGVQLFLELLVTKKLINETNAIPGDRGRTGDSIFTPQVQFGTGLGPKDKNDVYWSSAWQDFSANYVEKTSSNRAANNRYMGQPLPP